MVPLMTFVTTPYAPHRVLKPAMASCVRILGIHPIPQQRLRLARLGVQRAHETDPDADLVHGEEDADEDDVGDDAHNLEETSAMSNRGSCSRRRVKDGRYQGLLTKHMDLLLGCG